MSADVFIEWLDSKISIHETEKLTPPKAVLADAFDERVTQLLRDTIAERVLRDAQIDEQVTAALATLDADIHQQRRNLREIVCKQLEQFPDHWWRHPVEDIAKTIADLAAEKSA